MSLVRTIKGLLRGRWQVPVAGLALLAGWAAVERLSPPPRQISIDSLKADLATLVAKKAYYDAADAAANLLAMNPPLPEPEQAVLHNILADTIFQSESLRDEPLAKNAELIIQHTQEALRLGARLDAVLVRRLGQAHEWLGHVPEAVLAYRDALQRDAAPDLRRQTLQSIVRIMAGRAEFAAEREKYVEELLAQEGVSPAFVWEALQHAVDDALSAGDMDRARAVLERDGIRFKRSDLQGYYEYLAALINVADGRTDEALPQIDWVDTWFEQSTAPDIEMHRVGFLPAMNRWLRGRLALTEDRPQEALSAFSEALSLQSYGHRALLVAAGQAEALARLDRHSAARDIVREAVRRLLGDRAAVTSGLPVLRTTLQRLHEDRRRRADYQEAARYLELALEYAPQNEPIARAAILESLGKTYASAAAQAGGSPATAAGLHVKAGTRLEEAAALALNDDERRRELLWSSASEYDEAGETSGAGRMFAVFIDVARRDQRRPQAILRLGQAIAAEGRFSEAVAWFNRLVEEYPILPEAYRARLLIADAMIAQGQEQFPAAEALLVELLERGEVNPTAPAFREALFTLGDLLYQQRRYTETIRRIADYLELYPDDAERSRLRFLLADSYRQSAFQLRDNANSPTPEARDESRKRFERAVAIFQDFLNEIGDAPEAADMQTLQRLALFARADCLFEINTPDSLTEALASYRAATARYQTSPTALSAQVQIANIYLRMGKVTEAARAVEHARWLLGGIPDDAFIEQPQTRSDWDRQFNVLAASPLLRDVFAAAP